MRIINRITLALAYIRSKWFTMIFICILIIWGSVFINKFFNKRIRACCKIRSIRKRNNILISTNRKPFYVPDFIYVFPGQFSWFHVLFLAFISLYNDTQLACIFAFDIDIYDVFNFIFKSTNIAWSKLI